MILYLHWLRVIPKERMVLKPPLQVQGDGLVIGRTWFWTRSYVIMKLHFFCGSISHRQDHRYDKNSFITCINKSLDLSLLRLCNS